MPQVDLIEESFVVAAADRVAAVLRDPTRWARWWPDLSLSVFQDRAEQGIRWTVSGALVGSMEVWLEPHADGVIVHHYVRADLAGGRVPPVRVVTREARRRAMHAKRLFWALKDELEGARRPGEGTS
ncbi:MAG TPA: polyketide cyclase / dehydrase and lipid transport [Mycobacteriales bacterium]